MTAQSVIFAVNGGQSSIKSAVYQAVGSTGPLASCHISGIGYRAGGQEYVPDYQHALARIADWWHAEKFPDPMIVCHRVVHAAMKYREPVRVTDEIIADLDAFSGLDPEHLPSELMLIRYFRSVFPKAVAIACFDSAFHAGMPDAASRLPIPRAYAQEGIRAWGFHGLAYASIVRQLPPRIAKGNVVIAHLGSGCSVAAIVGGKSIDTSMSFTPSSGIPMGTRSGDIDPGLLQFLAQKKNMNMQELFAMATKQSGLLGMSGFSADMQELVISKDPRAAEAIDVFCYRVKKQIGAYAAAMGGVDTLIFSGGIGVSSPHIRQKICEGLSFLGIALDETKKIRKNVLVVEADECGEMAQIARDWEKFGSSDTII